MATPSASRTVIVPATWPFRRMKVSATKKKIMGMAATSEDSHRLPIGSYICCQVSIVRCLLGKVVCDEKNAKAPPHTGKTGVFMPLERGIRRGLRRSAGQHLGLPAAFVE